MFNQATLIGNLGKDPEIRTMGNGDRVASFSMATSERWTDKGSGQKKEATEWHNVVCFNQGLVKVIEDYCIKGKTVMVQGQIKTRKWQDKDGRDRWSTEIVLGRFNGTLQLLGGKSGDGGSDDRYGDGEHSYGTQRERSGDPNRREDYAADLDDEIPF